MSSCSSDNSSAERLELNKKYSLESWPDSAYIAELDSILKAEPLKPNADSGKTELTIYSGNIPTIALPGQKKSTTKTSAEKRSNAPVQKAEAKPAKNAERFADAFMNALGEFQSDPSNSAIYKVISANDGEDLFALLSRAYGKDATKLPRFYTLSTLQSVNPGVKLEHLNAGDKVRVPKL